MISGSMNGFSRLVMHLTVATNNRAQISLQAFLEWVRRYGIPQRVRTDRGEVIA